MSSEEPQMIKILAYDTEDGETLFFNGYTTNDAEYVGRKVMTAVGVGNPFMAFYTTSLPQPVEANPIWDESSAPIVTDNIGTNAAMINEMLSDVALQTVPNRRIWENGKPQPS